MNTYTITDLAKLHIGKLLIRLSVYPGVWWIKRRNREADGILYDSVMGSWHEHLRSLKREVVFRMIVSSHISFADIIIPFLLTDTSTGTPTGTRTTSH